MLRTPLRTILALAFVSISARHAIAQTKLLRFPDIHGDKVSRFLTLVAK